MANLSMLYNIKSDQSALSGGAWLGALPLNNIQNRRLAKVARSTDTLKASTQFIIDMGVDSSVTYKSVALLYHNLSTKAQYRVRCSNDVSMATTDYDSGWKEAYEYTIATTETIWEENQWWDGKPTPYDLQDYPLNTIDILDHITYSRYIKIEIDDENNTDGFIDIGRVFLSNITELLVNMNYGASIKWQDNSVVSESLGGTEFFYEKRKKRIFSCSSEFITDDIALSTIFEMQKASGITGEIFVMPNRDDLVNSFRTSFLARMTELSGISRYTHQHHKTSYQFKEIL